MGLLFLPIRIAHHPLIPSKLRTHALASTPVFLFFFYSPFLLLEALTVRENDGLVLPLDVIAVLPGQHVDLALVHAQLADVSLRKLRNMHVLFSKNSSTVQ